MQSILEKWIIYIKLSGIYIYILDTKINSDDMNFVLAESDFLIPVSHTELLIGFTSFHGDYMQWSLLSRSHV